MQIQLCSFKGKSSSTSSLEHCWNRVWFCSQSGVESFCRVWELLVSESTASTCVFCSDELFWQAGLEDTPHSKKNCGGTRLGSPAQHCFLRNDPFFDAVAGWWVREERDPDHRSQYAFNPEVIENDLKAVV